jgi:hypothetical protein
MSRGAIKIWRMFHPKECYLLFYLCVLTYTLSASVAAEEYSFEIDEYTKKTYQLGGYAELRPVLSGLDEDAALTHLNFFDQKVKNPTPELNTRLQLEGRVERGTGRLFLRLNSDYQRTHMGEDLDISLYDAYATLRPISQLTFEVGKKSLRWGTGYAWNPVAFIDRPKDPDDPELNLEGFVIGSATYIMSFPAPLQTLALMPVLIPVSTDINDDFGTSAHLNIGAKIYALFYDTDLNLTFLSDGSKTSRYGFDFARNLTSNFEIHAEFAYLSAAQQKLVDGSGGLSSRKAEAISYLLGLRYLTRRETTLIAEYYHNGVGFSPSEMENYYALIERGCASLENSGDITLLREAQKLGGSGYTRPTPMRNYAYLRITQKEPFDILYVHPGISTMVNLDDHSFSLAPEIEYTAIKNLELRFKGTWLHGSAGSEFGERKNAWRLEMRLRYYL